MPPNCRVRMRGNGLTGIGCSIAEIDWDLKFHWELRLYDIVIVLDVVIVGKNSYNSMF